MFIYLCLYMMLGQKLNRGDFMRDVTQYWEELQIRVALFINGDAIPRQNGEKKVRGLYQRLKGLSYIYILSSTSTVCLSVCLFVNMIETRHCSNITLTLTT